jgi:hypothetical protein
MEAVILSKEQYNDMVMRIEELQKITSQNSNEPKVFFVDNQEFLQLINVSKRIKRTWQHETLFIVVFKIIIDVWFYS